MNKTLTGKTPFDNLQQPLTNLSDGAEGLHTHKLELGRFKMHQHCHQLCQVTSDAFGSGKIFHRGQKDAEDSEHEGEAKLKCTRYTGTLGKKHCTRTCLPGTVANKGRHIFSMSLESVDAKLFQGLGNPSTSKLWMNPSKL